MRPSEAAQSGRAAVVIPAAGSGLRLGGGEPKALRLLAGRSLLARCVETFASVDEVVAIVAVVPADRVEQVTADLAAGAEEFPSTRVLAVAGGLTRQESVANGLSALAGLAVAQADYVLVHDAARPLVPRSVIERVLDALARGDEAVVPGLPVADTIKVVSADEVVVDTPPRGQLRAIQTPQGFTFDALSRAHAVAAAAGAEGTDDAALVELAGGVVRVVLGDPLAGKVTTAADFAVMAILAEEGTRP